MPPINDSNLLKSTLISLPKQARPIDTFSVSKAALGTIIFGVFVCNSYCFHSFLRAL